MSAHILTRSQRGEVFSKGRHERKVKARSLLCYWAVREAGIPLRTLATGDYQFRRKNIVISAQ